MNKNNNEFNDISSHFCFREEFDLLCTMYSPTHFVPVRLCHNNIISV